MLILANRAIVALVGENVMSNGKVSDIFVVLTAGAPMEHRDEVLALSGFGLSGDRYANGKVAGIRNLVRAKDKLHS